MVFNILFRIILGWHCTLYLYYFYFVFLLNIILISKYILLLYCMFCIFICFFYVIDVYYNNFFIPIYIFMVYVF